MDSRWPHCDFCDHRHKRPRRVEGNAVLTCGECDCGMEIADNRGKKHKRRWFSWR